MRAVDAIPGFGERIRAGHRAERFYGASDLPNFFYRYWFDKMPWDDYESYWQRSPLSRVGNVTTPTMIVTGEEDYRTPMWESEQFYQALKLRGVDTLLVRVPGASHSLDVRPSMLNARIAYILAWFAKHDAAATPAPAGEGTETTPSGMRSPV